MTARVSKAERLREAESEARLRCVGVLLAAGSSQRMGVPKLLLPWPPKHLEKEGSPAKPSTVIAAAHELLHQVCGTIVLVHGADARSLCTALGTRSFIAVPGSPEGEMLDSAKRGLEAALAARPDLAHIVLHPADHPEATSQTLSLLAIAASNHPHEAIMPEAGGRGGHPVFIPRELVSALLQWEGPDGVAGFWRAHPKRVRRMIVPDQAITWDLDTPSDYAMWIS